MSRAAAAKPAEFVWRLLQTLEVRGREVRFHSCRLLWQATLDQHCQLTCTCTGILSCRSLSTSCANQERHSGSGTHQHHWAVAHCGSMGSLQQCSNSDTACRSKSVSQAVTDAASASAEAARSATAGLRQQAGQVCQTLTAESGQNVQDSCVPCCKTLSFLLTIQ